MRDFDRNHKGNLPVIKGIVWCHEKSLASFGCCFVTRGSDARADPCVIIRKCPCDFVLTKQITERALPPIPDGGGGVDPLGTTGLLRTLISASFPLLLYLIYTVSLQLPHQRCCF